MIKVGLIGESPNDTDSIINFLSKHYQSKFRFLKLIPRIVGNNLESLGKMKKVLSAEVKSRSDISLVIFIRDLDDSENNAQALSKRRQWFDRLQEVLNIESFLLLNIYELEALILADIETFNKMYAVKIIFKGDPMKQPNPKEFLMQHAKNKRKPFQERDNPQIFKKLNLNIVKQNCRYFNAFVAYLDSFPAS